MIVFDRRADRFSATVTVTTSLIDAEPVSSSTSLPPLPTGTFVVPLKNPSPSSQACLTDATQAHAWACINGPSVSLQVLPSGTARPQVCVMPGPMTDAIFYGAQPPQLAHPADLMIMKDKNDRDKGPAYFFQEKYNKVVILRETDLSLNSKRWLAWDMLASRDTVQRSKGGWNQDDVDQDDIVKKADKPWYCHWNDTILEGFIYTNQNYSNAATTSAPLTAASPSAASGFLSWSNIPLPSSTYSAYSTSPTAGDPWPKRDAATLPYPFSIKLEERRGPHSPQPYCQQMQILLTGQPGPLTIQESGDPVIIQLDEDEPMQQNRIIYENGPQQRRASSESTKKVIENRESPSGACQCQWKNG